MRRRGNNMGINIFEELDTPDHSLTGERTERVLRGAWLGKTAVEVFDGYSDAGVLYGAIKKLAIIGLNPDELVGMCAGVRAARFGQYTDFMGSEGYRITDPTEVDQIRSAKYAGLHAAELNEGRAFLPILTDTLAVAQTGGSSFHQAADFLGITLGMQEAQLQGVRL